MMRCRSLLNRLHGGEPRAAAGGDPAALLNRLHGGEHVGVCRGRGGVILNGLHGGEGCRWMTAGDVQIVN